MSLGPHGNFRSKIKGQQCLQSPQNIATRKRPAMHATTLNGLDGPRPRPAHSWHCIDWSHCRLHHECHLQHLAGEHHDACHMSVDSPVSLITCVRRITLSVHTEHNQYKTTRWAAEHPKRLPPLPVIIIINDGIRFAANDDRLQVNGMQCLATLTSRAVQRHAVSKHAM